MTSIDTESRREIASRHSSDSDSEFVSGVAPPLSPPPALRRRSRARSSCILQRARSASVLEPVAAAPAIVGGSLRNLTPLFYLPGKTTVHNSQPDHGNCKDL